MDYSDHCGMMPKSKAIKIITMAYFEPYTWGNSKSKKKIILSFCFLKFFYSLIFWNP